MRSMIDVTRPLQRFGDPESHRENADGPSQVAAPPLPVSSSLDLLTRTSVLMPSIANYVSKRHKNSAGEGGCQLTMLSAPPSHIALQPVVIVPADIAHNLQAIFDGVSPPL